MTSASSGDGSTRCMFMVENLKFRMVRSSGAASDIYLAPHQRAAVCALLHTPVLARAQARSILLNLLSATAAAQAQAALLVRRLRSKAIPGFAASLQAAPPGGFALASDDSVHTRRVPSPRCCGRCCRRGCFLAMYDEAERRFRDLGGCCGPCSRYVMFVSCSGSCARPPAAFWTLGG